MLQGNPRRCTRGCASPGDEDHTGLASGSCPWTACSSNRRTQKRYPSIVIGQKKSLQNARSAERQELCQSPKNYVLKTPDATPKTHPIVSPSRRVNPRAREPSLSSLRRHYICASKRLDPDFTVQDGSVLGARRNASG